MKEMDFLATDVLGVIIILPFQRPISIGANAAWFGENSDWLRVEQVEAFFDCL